MLLAQVLARLAPLPDPLPPPDPGIDAVVLGRGGATPGWVRPDDRPSTRDAAALLLLYPEADGEMHLVLTTRPDGTHRHAGQVALPGGKRDPDDAFPEGTALREAAEEIGLDTTHDAPRILGVLDTVDVRVSGFRLVPVLAVLDHAPRLIADGREVERILRAPVRLFLPGAPIEVVEAERDGWRLRYGAYPVDGRHVWGATGRVVAQLGAVLGGS